MKLLLFNVLIIIIVCIFVRSKELDFVYHNNEELEGILRHFTVKGSNHLKTNLYSIGNSSGRPKKNIQPSPIWVFKLTAAEEDTVGIPNVKLIGNVHGTEPAGRELLLHFIEYLIENYGKDDLVTWILNNTKIHFLPSLNPDGFAVANEFYCVGCSTCLGMGVTDDDIVITSNFPDYFHSNEVLYYTAETSAVMRWMDDVKFVLSGSFFGSFLVAIYPYCNKNETRIQNPTPDDDVFQFLAKTYANNHPVMYKGENCPESSLHFDGGIINGASWHNHDADMTDYNYIFRGCMEVRLEISCCKYPSNDELSNLWLDNKNSLLQYIMQANRGVTGQVLDVISGQPVQATMKITGRDIEFGNFKPTGEYWRILLPGEYQVEVQAEGYYKQIQNFTVEDHGKDHPELSQLNIYLLNSSVSTTTTTTEKATMTTTEARESTTTSTTEKTEMSNTMIEKLVTKGINSTGRGNSVGPNKLVGFVILANIVKFVFY